MSDQGDDSNTDVGSNSPSASLPLPILPFVSNQQLQLHQCPPTNGQNATYIVNIQQNIQNHYYGDQDNVSENVMSNVTPPDDEDSNDNETFPFPVIDQDDEGQAPPTISIANVAQVNIQTNVHSHRHYTDTSRKTTTTTSNDDETNWIVNETLGSGSYGVVKLVSSRNDPSRKLARKEVVFKNPRNQNEIKKAMLEVEALQKCNHRNIVKLHHSCKSEDGLYLHIYMEYIGRGTLHQLIQDRKKLSEEQCREFTKQLLEGINYLHGTNTMHRDLKPANILLTEDNITKIADFGVCKIFEEVSMATSIIGTPLYAAKEVFSGKYGRKCDIWSLGIVAMEMLTGSNPWSKYKHPCAAMCAISVKGELPNYQQLEVTEQLKNFLSLSFKDESQRPSSEEMLSHKWFATVLTL